MKCLGISVFVFLMVAAVVTVLPRVTDVSGHAGLTPSAHAAASQHITAFSSTAQDLSHDIRALSEEIRLHRATKGTSAAGTTATPPASQAVSPAAAQAATAPATQRTSKRGPYRVYVYDLTERLTSNLEGELHELMDMDPRCPKCWLSGYAMEQIVHQYMLASPHRTMDPDEADFFYVPLYAHIYLRMTMLRRKKRNSFPATLQAKMKDLATLDTAVKMAVLKNDYSQWERVTGITSKYWRAFNGRNHILSSGHAGPFHHWMFEQDTLLRTSAIILTVEISRAAVLKQASKGSFDRRLRWYHKNIHMPFPWFNTARPLDARTGRTLLPDGSLGPQRYMRSYTAAGYSDHANSAKVGMKIRREMHKQAKAKASKQHIYREFVESDMDDIEDMYSSAVFCPCPAGDGPATRRIFSVADYGCIPVLIADDLVLPFEQHIDYRAFSIFLPESTVWGNQWMEILDAIKPETVRALQQGVRAYRDMMRFGEPPSLSKGGKATFDGAYSMMELRLAELLGSYVHRQDVVG